MKTRFLAMQIKLTSMVVHQAYLDREAKCNSEMGYLYDDNYHVPIDAAQWKTAQLTSGAGHIIFHVLLNPSVLHMSTHRSKYEADYFQNKTSLSSRQSISGVLCMLTHRPK